MDLELNSEQIALQQSCKQFAENEISPYITQLESENEFRKSLFVRMAKMGFFNLSVPHLHSRHQYDTVAYAAAVKEISKADAGIGVTMSVANMVAESIELFGTEEQKKRFLKKISGGVSVPLAFALTEKESGSDPKNLKTRATLDPNDSNYYIIHGDKQFITNGDIAGLFIVMARTDEGITAFIIDELTKGLEVAKRERKMGLLTVNLCDLHFAGVRVPKAHILGLQNEGLKIAMTSLDSGRIGIAAQAVGIAEAAYESALEYAVKRKQFGSFLIEHQAIAFMLANMHVKINAGTLLLYKAARQKDLKKPYTLEASEAKLFCSEMCNEVASDAVQIHGGYGYVKDNPVERYFRDARATTLYEGTSEIQRIVISRQIAKQLQS